LVKPLAQPAGVDPQAEGGRWSVPVPRPAEGAAYVVEVDGLRLDPGGTTGWHSHPGPALVVVKDGTITLYDGDDRRCRPHRYGPGQAFVDEGGGHVHIARNETRHPVQVLVTFIIPKGTEPFIDAPDPGNCHF
jgi:quercetin dioxygenase-like cupin family protein